MTETTLGQLINAEHGLGLLAKTDLSVKASYRIARLLKAVRDEMRTYHETREQFIKELGEERPQTPDEQKLSNSTDPVVAVTDANVPEFMKRMQELLDQRVNLTVPLLPLEYLGDLKISPAHMDLLVPVITETE